MFELNRDVRMARRAFKKGDVKEMIAAHEGYNKHNHHKTGGKYVKSIVYGGLDGIITTFAVVAGVAGAGLAAGIVLILGFANLIADGISMAVGDYLSSKSEKEYYDAEREREKWEVDNYPKGEEKEMIELYTRQGLSEKDAKCMVEVLKKNKDVWIDTMMVEELNLIKSDESPVMNGIVTFFSFAFFGLIPLLVYIYSWFFPGVISNNFLAAIVLTGVALLGLGFAKVKVTEKSWWRSGIETLLIGGVAAGAAYFVGYLLGGIV